MQEIAALRTAHQLLTQAKHDYDGHRVKAMHEITQAVQAMLPNQGQTGQGKTGTKGIGNTTNGTKGTGNTTNGTKGTGNTTNGTKGTGSTTNGTKTPTSGTAGAGAGGKGQAQSDALLKQAQQILQTVQGQMGTRHPKAKGFVQAAVKELNTALQIR